mmetsp:Transcript_13483/g.31341  ORF Transcript_13483/g.31341 Transcript_13483/m.31341 type:complete len:169 (-) Transcript_13483:213-719(-)
MGSSQSVVAITRTSLDAPSSTSQSTGNSTPPPMHRIETFEEKLYRKVREKAALLVLFVWTDSAICCTSDVIFFFSDFSNPCSQFTKEPLVPIGCLVTAYFLGNGIRSFYNRNSVQSQKMMRARVGAQFATLMIFIGYYGWNSFDFKLAPMYQASKQLEQQKKQQKDGA